MMYKKAVDQIVFKIDWNKGVESQAKEFEVNVFTNFTKMCRVCFTTPTVNVAYEIHSLYDLFCPEINENSSQKLSKCPKAWNSHLEVTCFRCIFCLRFGFHSLILSKLRFIRYSWYFLGSLSNASIRFIHFGQFWQTPYIKFEGQFHAGINYSSVRAALFGAKMGMKNSFHGGVFHHRPHGSTLFSTPTLENRVSSKYRSNQNKTSKLPYYLD